MRNKKGLRDRGRFVVLVVFLSLAFFSLIGRLYKIQIIDHQKYLKKKIQQSKSTILVSPERGTIFDRRGRILALTADSYSIYLMNRDQKRSIKELNSMRKVVFFSKKEFKDIYSRIKKGRRFIWIKRKTDEHTVRKIMMLSLSDVGVLKEKKRYYPNGRLASHVLGTVSIDNRGLEGIERKFDSYLSGKPGKVIIKRDARRKVFEEIVLKKPEKGEDLKLTIDKVVQYIAERELYKAVKFNKASWGSVIVMNSKSGEILAMASYPNYNPNNPRSLTDENRKNRAIEENYTPGSTFKIITLSSAFEGGFIRKNAYYNCSNGVYNFNGITIRDHGSFDLLTPRDILVKSSNICSAKIANRMGKKFFYKMIKKFRIGENTGIELPGEERGIVRKVSLWTDLSELFIGFGYEIAATPLQMLEVANVIATGGYYIKPTIVYGENPRLKSIKVISESTAEILKDFMKDVVNEGTGRKARIPYFSVAGKTGTAELLINGKYAKDRHVASFVGFAPADKPVLTVIVVISDPKGGHYFGGDVAAPVFKNIVEESLMYLNVLPENEVKKIIIVKKDEEGKNESIS